MAAAELKSPVLISNSTWQLHMLHGGKQLFWDGRLTHCASNKMDTILQSIIPNPVLYAHFNFDPNFIAIWSHESNHQYARIGSDNDLAQSRQQAII